MVKVLVIEDDASLLETIKDLLEIEGYDVSLAQNGQVGIQMAQEILPDIIICDVVLQGVDGYKVLTTLKNIPETRTISFIYISAKLDRADLRRGMNLGADDYLTKPFTPAELLETLTSRLEKKNVFYDSLKQTENLLYKALYYDGVTGLLNRLKIREEFLKQMNFSLRAATTLAVIYLTLDRFPQLSEKFDMVNQNTFLKDVARQLNDFASNNRSAKVFRIQNDEFAIVMSSLKRKVDYEQVCSDLVSQFARPFSLTNFELYTTASLGASFYPFDGSEIEVLLDKARRSMLSVRKDKGNSFKFFEASLDNPNLLERHKLENHLYKALTQNELEVHYQPKIRVKSGNTTGAEALVRWNHPEYGYISPALFIPIAEESGLINSIGEWVLKMACEELKRHIDKGFTTLIMAVNISSRQLYEENFVAKVEQIGKETHIPFPNIELELTESTLVHNIATAKSTINNLKELGVKISIDDFGTGFSSLNYLKQLPFDVLKIDRSFIQHVGRDRQNSAITLATIQMAHSLHLKVIAEGVETQTELDFLKENGCDVVQGYYYSRPLKSSDFDEFLTLNPPMMG